MNKKKILMVVGVIAVFGIGYYVYTKNKAKSQSTASTTGITSEERKYMARIKGDETWLTAVTKDASDKGISLDKALLNHARWTIANKNK